MIRQSPADQLRNLKNVKKNMLTVLMNKIFHRLVANLKAADAQSTVVITSHTEVHISILFLLLFPIRICFPMHVNDF